MKILLLIILSLMFVPRVDAHYVDLNNMDISVSKKVKHLDTDYFDVHEIFEDRDGNILLIGYHRKVKENGNIIPGNDGGGLNGSPGGTYERMHVKFMKLDSSYNQLWETNVKQIGNWSNAEPEATTVSLFINSITQLKDGTYVAVGETMGLVREKNEYRNDFLADDDFDAFIIRLDQNGNEIHRESIRSRQVDNMLEVEALTNGGYAIKVYGWPQGYQNIEKTTFHYFVYDSNNELIDTFSNVDYLNNYSFENPEAILELTHSVGGNESAVRFQANSFYLGTTINNEILFGESKNDADFDVIKFYNPTTMTVTRQIDVSEYKIYTAEKAIMTNDGGFIIEGHVFDSDGTLRYKTDKKYMSSLTNGNLIYVDQDKDVYSTENVGNNLDVAKFIINGIEIKQNLGTFTENNRTYISLNNLCGIMDCKYKRSEKNNNKLIIDFNILDRGNNKMISKEDSTIKYKEDDGKLITSDGKVVETYGGTREINQAPKVNYTVVHEIGSKSFETYLSIQPYRIFRLNSPYYNENAVDVSSMEKNGQIYVPLRFISEALGRYVEYIPGENGEKPTIKIGAYGEGEFFEKYGVAISYTKLNEGDTLTAPINENQINLPWGMEKLAYGYGYNKLDNKIVNTSKTVYVPVRSGVPERGIDEDQAIPYNGVNDSSLTNHMYISMFETMDNWIGKNEMYYDNNGEEGEKYLEAKNYLTFVLVSNIEGYPFMKFVHFK